MGFATYYSNYDDTTPWQFSGVLYASNIPAEAYRKLVAAVTGPSMSTQAFAKLALGRVHVRARTARSARLSHRCDAHRPVAVLRMLQRDGYAGFRRLGGRRPL